MIISQIVIVRSWQQKLIIIKIGKKDDEYLDRSKLSPPPPGCVGLSSYISEGI